MEQNNNSGIFHMIGLAIIGVVIFIVANMSLTRVDTYLKSQAVDECAKISRYTKTVETENSTTYHPLPDHFKNCLKTKGYDN